ncbi:MAG: GNAT family N-acetyltransferase [Anaerolineaceae bacterium]
MLASIPTLKTPRLCLREISKSDVNDIYAIFSDRNVTKFYDVSTMRKVKSAEKLIDWWSKRFQKKKALRWGITMPAISDRIIGTCGFSELDFIAGVAEIGVDIARLHWHQGIMKEALSAVLNYGFTTLNLSRIKTWIMAENVYSIAGVKSLGFRNINETHSVFWQGKTHDIVYFVLDRNGYFTNHK